MVTAIRDWFQRALWDVVPRDQRMSTEALRRRQIVTVAFIVLGGLVLGFSLRLEPGSPWFYPATTALALVWTVGAFTSGPLHLGRVAHASGTRRPIITPIVIGALLVAMFVVGALVVRQIPFLYEQVQSVLDHAGQGAGPILVAITVVSGVAEELYFRGAVYAAATRYPVPVTTVAYGIATLATGNVMLAFAALLLGVVVGLQRRATGGVLAPILTHITWSTSMLFLLPLLFG